MAANAPGLEGLPLVPSPSNRLINRDDNDIATNGTQLRLGNLARISFGSCVHFKCRIFRRAPRVEIANNFGLLYWFCRSRSGGRALELGHVAGDPPYESCAYLAWCF